MAQSITIVHTPGVLSSSSVTLNNGLLPTRTVLRQNDKGEYVVCRETLTIAVQGADVVLTHESFFGGRYFGDDLAGALKEFAEARKA